MRFVTLLPYLFATGSLVLVSVLIYGISLRLMKLRDRIAKSEARIQAESAQVSGRLTALTRRLDELETSLPATVAPAVSGSSVNSTIRSKALKMHRLGQSPERIADTLRVPRGEVDLLVKAHRIVMRPYEGVPEMQGVERK